jgi:hypothetical protein
MSIGPDATEEVPHAHLMPVSNALSKSTKEVETPGELGAPIPPVDAEKSLIYLLQFIILHFVFVYLL